jgi:hypothetical protein
MELDTLRFAVTPRNAENLDYTTQHYFERLSNYEAPFLEEKLALTGEMASDEYTEAFTELKKYVAISKLYGKPLWMPSTRVDAVWHQFILFTRDYTKFCEEYHGQYLHHNPDIPSRRVEDTQSRHNLHTLYHRTFGEMPGIWRR